MVKDLTNVFGDPVERYPSALVSVLQSLSRPGLGVRDLTLTMLL